MRGLSTAVSGLVLVALASCADRTRPQFADGRLAPAGPLDFGTVVVNHSRELEMQLRNVGRGAVTVDEAWTLGPDRTFEVRLVGDARVLQSGEVTTVRVRYTPRQAGTTLGQLGVRTDSRVEPVFRMPVTGNGVAGAATVTPAFLDFGRIEAGASKVLVLTIENPSTIAVEVKPQTVGADLDELDAGLSFTLAPGERRLVDVAFRPDRVGHKQLALAVTPCDTCADELVSVAALAIEQAVVGEPGLVDFGPVPVDRVASRSAALKNVSTESALVQGLDVGTPSDDSFSVGVQKWPVRLAPGARLEVLVSYSPGHMGVASGLLLFKVASRRHPTTEVALTAMGGAAELCMTPAAFDFGVVPLGSKAAATIDLMSCGASNAPPAVVTGVDSGLASSPGGDPFVLSPVPLPRALAAGEVLTLKVEFRPVAAGDAEAQLVVHSTAYLAQSVQLSLSGHGQAHPACEIAAAPERVDFGTVPPGRGAVLGVRLENRGAELCTVSVDLGDDAGGAFWLPGGTLDGLVMDPGNSFSFMVAFRGPRIGGYQGGVKLSLGGGVAGPQWVPLEGHAADSCLVATPPYLDFGVGRPDCRPGPRAVHLENGCAAQTMIRGVVIGHGTADGDFLLTPAPLPWPRGLAAGQGVSSEVSYLATTAGLNLSPLFVDVDDLEHPLLVPLVGESDWRMTQTDRFVQQTGSELDVLFVVDNTASMVEEQPRLLAALPALASAARLAGSSLHVGFTTTGLTPASTACPGGAEGGEAGRLFPADGSAPRLLTLATPSFEAALKQNASVGLCAYVEQGLEAARRALTAPLVDSADDPRTPLPNDGNLGFLRDEAALAVVVVSDEDDHSPDDVDTYVRFLRALKGMGQPGRAALFALAPTATPCATAGGEGTRYSEAAQRTGGDVESICAADYAPFLAQVPARVAGPQARFPLSEVPDPATLAVTVDGVLTQTVTYDAARNEIDFAVTPQGGSRIEVNYRRVCP